MNSIRREQDGRAPAAAAIAREPHRGARTRRREAAADAAGHQHIAVEIIHRLLESARHLGPRRRAAFAARPGHHVVLRLRAVPGQSAVPRADGDGARVGTVLAEHIVPDRVAAAIADVAGGEIGDQRAFRILPETAGIGPRAELVVAPVDHCVIHLAGRARRAANRHLRPAPESRRAIAPRGAHHLLSAPS